MQTAKTSDWLLRLNETRKSKALVYQINNFSTTTSSQTIQTLWVLTVYTTGAHERSRKIVVKIRGQEKLRAADPSSHPAVTFQSSGICILPNDRETLRWIMTDDIWNFGDRQFTFEAARSLKVLAHQTALLQPLDNHALSQDLSAAGAYGDLWSCLSLVLESSEWALRSRFILRSDDGESTSNVLWDEVYLAEWYFAATYLHYHSP